MIRCVRDRVILGQPELTRIIHYEGAIELGMSFDCSMVINKLEIKNNKLNLAVTISYPFNAEVHLPKVKIVFECNGKMRRLPFRITNYLRHEQTNTCIVGCSYTFLLEKLFYNYDPTGDIKARIAFYYGKDEVEAVPFSVAPEVLSVNNPLDFEKKYFKRDVKNSVGSSDENADENGECTFDFDYENFRIIISKSSKSQEKPLFYERLGIFVPLLKIAFFALRLMFALLLSPILVADGILAGLCLIPQRNTKVVYGLKESILEQIRANFASFMKMGIFNRSGIIRYLREQILEIFKAYYSRLCKKSVVPNRVTFMSGRRDELTGNLKFVYDLIKDRDDIDFQFLLFSDPAGHNRITNIKRFSELYATSKVVIIDDYFRLISMFDKRDEVKLFQLWHACGAFKTFGFSRLGKRGGPKQIDTNHRMYDYAIVSSRRIAKHYAEGFGISDECIIATGSPRTDIFMDEAYAAAARTRFYEKYPQLKGKKLLLFAPTFRGNGQMSAFYPTAAFHPGEVYDALGGEYAILIKLHPFCHERFEIPEQYREFIIDFSGEDELNDLLFVADLLVTDYSSVIFEASLLDIPMLFYSFDLEEYISSRDFYYDYKSFVPGKIVYNEEELTRAILEGDFEFDKVKSIKYEFFDDLDGLSSQRVADHIINAIQDTAQ